MTANLSYKMTNISEKDKLMSFKKIFFIIQFFLCLVKSFLCTLVGTSAHREDHCVRQLIYLINELKN